MKQELVCRIVVEPHDGIKEFINDMWFYLKMSILLGLSLIFLRAGL